jgi:cell division protein FtsI/penicillin-binding protein 2
MTPPCKLAHRTARTAIEELRLRTERCALQSLEMKKLPTILVRATLLLFVLLAGDSLAGLASENTGDREKLQQAVERAMEGRTGAAVVADVSTGQILAAQGLDLAARRLERPGSTVKPFVLKDLLESGKLNASQRLQCRRPLWIAGVRMDCTHPDSVADLNAEEAIAYSCNSYFADAATRLSSKELTQALRRAGFDSPTGLAKEEASGRIEIPRDRSMLQLEALGDRGIEVTSLELLRAYRRLALQKRNGIAAEVDGPVFAGLEQSVAYGMAHAANVDGMSIAGKTGTAASRESAKTHGFFLGYAPADKPEIVVVVYLEQGRGGDAAGLAHSVFAEFAKNRKIP